MRTFLTGVCLITGLVVPASADACSCQEQSVSEARAQAAAIFEGRVVSIEKVAPSEEGGDAGLAVTLEIDRAWKGGGLQDTVVVHTPSTGAVCGYPFKTGVDYLVYATADDTSAMRVSLCSRTKPVAKAKEDHDFLGEETERHRSWQSPQHKNEHAAAALSDRCTIGVHGSATPSGVVALLLLGAICARRARD